MDFKSLVNLLSDRINQHQVIEHYLTMVYKTGFKEGGKQALLDLQKNDFYCKDKCIANATECFDDYIPCDKMCDLCRNELE